MEIRKATYSDMPELMRIFASAKHWMRKNDNLTQWVNGYPSEALLTDEINKSHCFLCLHHGKAVGTFCFIIGNDPTYDVIENGTWLNDHPYAVIHRLASDGTFSGLAKECFDWCFQRCNNIRVDTHKDNKPMQVVLLNHGFQECGIIHIADGTPRIAFQKSL